jgi:hypothetical protein
MKNGVKRRRRCVAGDGGSKQWTVVIIPRRRYQILFGFVRLPRTCLTLCSNATLRPAAGTLGTRTRCGAPCSFLAQGVGIYLPLL